MLQLPLMKESYVRGNGPSSVVTQHKLASLGLEKSWQESFVTGAESGGKACPRGERNGLEVAKYAPAPPPFPQEWNDETFDPSLDQSAGSSGRRMWLVRLPGSSWKKREKECDSPFLVPLRSAWNCCRPLRNRFEIPNAGRPLPSLVPCVMVWACWIVRASCPSIRVGGTDTGEEGRGRGGGGGVLPWSNVLSSS